jgi:hypothetical protein
MTRLPLHPGQLIEMPLEKARIDAKLDFHYQNTLAAIQVGLVTVPQAGAQSPPSAAAAGGQ